MLGKGRERIFTNYREVNRENLVAVLKDAFETHYANKADIEFLMQYEKGNQPLQREKTIRPEIDVHVTDNLANYIKEWKVNYFWSSPIMLIQRGNNEIHGTDSDSDDNGISALNEMLIGGENMSLKDQQAGEFAEICGLGYKYVDIRTDFDGLSLIHNYAPDPRYAFCVYRNDISQRKVLSVTYNEDSNGVKYITAFTDSRRYELKDFNIIAEEVNPLGRIPLVEILRNVDRMGCFERQISELDALNILNSDYVNAVAQTVQEIWWGNDIDFPTDENGNIVKPQSGQWLLTYTNEGNTNPKVQALSSTLDGNNTLSSISNTRSWILTKCNVPLTYNNLAGGSTGVATDMSSGWSAAELEAQAKEQIVKAAKREELDLILRALRFVPTSQLPADSEMREVHVTDVDFHFNRKRNYDMTIKANAFATYVSHGLNGRHALKVIDAFEDTEQVWLDSKEGIEEYQASIIGNAEERIMSDNADQINNSPIVDGMQTRQTEE